MGTVWVVCTIHLNTISWPGLADGQVSLLPMESLWILVYIESEAQF